MGTTAHSLSACSQELLASILCTRSASACMEWQTAHECYIALRSPQMPHKEHGQKCTTNLWWWMWWMPQLSCSIEYTTIRFMCSVSSLLELHCHFLLGRTCPGGPSWRSTPLSYLKASLSFFSLFSCTHSVQLLPSFLTTLWLHASVLPACEGFHISMNTNLSTSRCIHWLSVVRFHIMQSGVIPSMLVHSTPGLNDCVNSEYNFKTYCNLYFYHIEIYFSYISANSIKSW